MFSLAGLIVTGIGRRWDRILWRPQKGLVLFVREQGTPGKRHVNPGAWLAGSTVSKWLQHGIPFFMDQEFPCSSVRKPLSIDRPISWHQPCDLYLEIGHGEF